MQFYFYAAEKTIEKPFGTIIHGLRYNDERPLICYISSLELQNGILRLPLVDYLDQIRNALVVGGRIEIK